jgi:hypothetical protein
VALVPFKRDSTQRIPATVNLYIFRACFVDPLFCVCMTSAGFLSFAVLNASVMLLMP